MKITIIDYGVGNVKSIINTIDKLGFQAILSSDAKTILASDFVILPGVGAFGAAVEKLVETGLFDVVKQYALTQKPLLGICVGMQILLDKGFEMGAFDGLGLIPGSVKMIPTTAKLPQIGWNNVIKQNDATWTKSLDDESYVYFVHSYYCELDESYVDTYTEYGGVKIPAMIRYNNIYGTQFHPEKSGSVGKQILADILQEVKR